MLGSPKYLLNCSIYFYIIPWVNSLLTLGLLGTVASAPQSAQAGSSTKTKNVIIMVGDGMGWEMARAAAVAKVADFYTSGKGSGLSYQNLEGYGLATTYGTTIAPGNGVFDAGNSALDGSNPLTGASSRLSGFTFNPTFNPGINEDGGAVNPSSNAVGNLVGYDPVRGGANPWASGSDREYIKYSYPDSANTATTLYTGVKTYNGAVGVNIFEQPLETLLDVATNRGKSTGLVTSVPIDHATPAAASAKVNDRGKYDDDFPALDNILQQQLRSSQPTVLLGGGHPAGDGNEFNYITESTYNALKDPNAPNGYGYTFLERGANAAEVLAATAAGIDPNSGERLLGLYGARGQGGNLPWATANGDYSNVGFESRTDTDRPLALDETDADFIAKEVDENPTLDDMTLAALDVLGKDPDGFWMMVEGGDIDWAAHDNSLDNMIGATLSFERSVQSVINWIENNGGWEENLLLVTADHDHYLNLNPNFPQLLASRGAEALTAEENPALAGHYWGSDPNVKYGWGTHTNRPVPVYYQGKGAEVLTNSVGMGYQSYGFSVPGLPGLVDQTHIYQAQRDALTHISSPGSFSQSRVSTQTGTLPPGVRPPMPFPGAVVPQPTPPRPALVLPPIRLPINLPL